MLPASSQGQVGLVQTGCVRVYWHHGHEHVSFLETVSLCWSPHCCYCSAQLGWNTYLYVYPCNHTPETLCLVGKVQEGGLEIVLLGLETLCSSKRQHELPPESWARVCRTTGACIVHSPAGLRHWLWSSLHNLQKGKAINPLVQRPQRSTFTHRVMNHELTLWMHLQIFCYVNGHFREKNQESAEYIQACKKNHTWTFHWCNICAQ